MCACSVGIRPLTTFLQENKRSVSKILAKNFVHSGLLHTFGRRRGRLQQIQIVRPLESIAETQPQLQPALLRLSAMICQYFTDTAALLIDTDFARGATISCLTQYQAMRARPDAGAKSIRERREGT